MDNILKSYATTKIDEVKVWFDVGKSKDFPIDGGVCIKYKDLQVAVFNYSRINKWFACQNLCPHKMEMVISRGMIGEWEDGVAKVACPIHKHNFSLETGDCLTTELPKLATFPVKIVEDRVVVGFNH